MFPRLRWQVSQLVRHIRHAVPGWLMHSWSFTTAPVRWLGQTFVLAGQILAEWWTSRRWRHLIWGSPTVIVMGICAYFVLHATATTRGELAQKYLIAGRTATSSGQWKPATLYFERAIELGVRDREALFDLAIAAQKSGDESRKVAVLERLAPDDQAIYALAHMWKAKTALSVSPVPPEKLKLAEIHLRFVLQLEPDHREAHGILGEMYFQRGFMDGAANHLARTGKSNARIQIMLARACILSNRQFEAETSAQLAQRIAETAIGEDPNDLKSRLELGDALMILERFDESLAVLAEGQKTDAADLSLRAAISRVYLTYAKSVLDRGGDPQSKRSAAFQLVAAAMQQNPDDPSVFDLMMEIVSLDDSAAAEAREFLLSCIVSGRAVGISHLLLGTSLQEAGDAAQAAFHLEQAFKLLPEGAVVANNLAWCLVYLEKPEPGRALKIIQEVIQRFPNNPAFVDTRGHVYLKLGEWKKAVDDFQVSLTQFADQATVHVGLVEAYENLGMKDLAERHRAIAEHLQTLDHSKKTSKVTDRPVP